jgi:hypothetical protein
MLAKAKIWYVGRTHAHTYGQSNGGGGQRLSVDLQDLIMFGEVCWLNPPAAAVGTHGDRHTTDVLCFVFRTLILITSQTDAVAFTGAGQDNNKPAPVRHIKKKVRSHVCTHSHAGGRACVIISRRCCGGDIHDHSN